MILISPFAAFGIYYYVGMFGAPDYPYAKAKAAREAELRLKNDFALLENLRKKLDAGKGDYNGRLLLGRGYYKIGDTERAKTQYQKALKTGGDKDYRALREYAQFLTNLSEGRVNPYAEKLFYQALKLKPKDFITRFYIGLSRIQSGLKKGGLKMWKSLAQDMKGANTEPFLRMLIIENAKKHKIDLKKAGIIFDEEQP